MKKLYRVEDCIVQVNGQEVKDKRMGRIKLTQDEIDVTARKLINHCNSLKHTSSSNGEIKYVVGISRGGLPLAVLLSNMLGVPMIPLTWKTRDLDDKFTNQDTDTLCEILEHLPIEHTLFVDDICDSGTTINQIREFIPDSRWAVCVSKRDDMNLEFVGQVFKGEEWIIFPWEKIKLED